ncbi:hypothetical protein N9Y42_07185 [Mariniblastus sp.]|nr:hypothetical protein [Mariniblastus sp.]
MIKANENNSIDYYIVQHVPDLFRREARNVGVIIEDANGNLDGQFFGESTSGKIDGRSVKQFENADIYLQWVKFWRRTMRKDTSSEEKIRRLVRPNGEHFNVVKGGAIKVPINDELKDVCNYAYSMLVSDKGLYDFLNARDSRLKQKQLNEEALVEFQKLGLLSSSLTVKNPIFPNASVKGKSRVHEFSFFQGGEYSTPIETFNFQSSNTKAPKDHAGWARYAFGDVMDKIENVRPIAIVRADESQRKSKTYDYSTGILAEVAEIIDWEDSDQRESFLDERLSLAK